SRRDTIETTHHSGTFDELRDQTGTGTGTVFCPPLIIIPGSDFRCWRKTDRPELRVATDLGRRFPPGTGGAFGPAPGARTAGQPVTWLALMCALGARSCRNFPDSFAPYSPQPA